jgi:choline dehydrogenase-like flavoprotein
MANKHVNAIVIGTGAGGGIVAKELSEAGLTVVLFERGRYQGFHDHKNYELMLGNAFGPDDERYRRVVKTRMGPPELCSPVKVLTTMLLQR